MTMKWQPFFTMEFYKGIIGKWPWNGSHFRPWNFTKETLQENDHKMVIFLYFFCEIVLLKYDSLIILSIPLDPKI